MKKKNKELLKAVTSQNKPKKSPVESFVKVFVQIESRDDETKWKEFFKTYFPNHYAKRLLDEDLVIDVVARHSGKAYQNKSVAVSPGGYGYISLRFAYYGGYQEVRDFEEFKLTACYKSIVAQGVTLEVGEPEVISIPNK